MSSAAAAVRLAIAVEASRLQLRRKRKTDDVAPFEAATEKLLASIFKEQSRRLKPPADLTNGTASLRALDKRWATVARATSRAAAAALSEALQAAYGEGAARFASELSAASEARIRFKAPPAGPDEIPLDDLGHAVLDGTVFKVKNPRAEKYLDRHAAKLVAGIDETTRDTLRVVVRDGMASGHSSQKIAKSITSRFSDMAVGRPQAHIASRAHGIAVTEMSFAYEAGQRAVADDVAAAGIAMEKSWLTVGDGKVDDICAGAADDGWIPLKDTFSSGDQEPPAHPYCRCTALHQPASKQPAAKPAAGPEPAEAPFELPEGPAADADAARAEYIDTFKPEHRAGMTEWVETSDEAGARIMRLDLGETPELEDTLEVWQVSDFDEIRTSAANDLATVDGQEVLHHSEMAEQLMDGVAEGASAPELFRGIAVDEATANSLHDLKTLDMNVSSWSSVEGFASSQAGDYRDDEHSVLVNFITEPGARGIELGAHIEDASAEWITAGRFKVDAAIRSGDRLDVYLRQEAVFTTPEQFRGLR